MYTLTPPVTPAQKTIPVSQMKPGDLGVLIKGNDAFIGDIMLRSYSQLISLNKPATGEWSAPLSINGLHVRLLEKGEVVELTAQ